MKINQSRSLDRRTSPWIAIRVVATIAALLAGVDRGTADAAVIFVTSLAQKVSATGGCSLQEAIFSANFDTNLISTPTTFFFTECVPGNGADVIVLPTAALLRMSDVQDDASSVFGPAATPSITSNLTIEGHGAVLEWVGIRNARAFTIGSTAFVTIRNVHIRGFRAKGGNGGDSGGGGGLGAGGAIFIKGSGQLTIEGSTFERNGAIGGVGGGLTPTGDNRGWGGGGGLGGDGGEAVPGGGGGGGGGSRGDGGASGPSTCPVLSCVYGGGGGGGGTLTKGGRADTAGGAGGEACGGAGGTLQDDNTVADGHSATCDGGGGGGGATVDGSSVGGQHGDGGDGGYGGGGGGAGFTQLTLRRDAVGGHGGFGGGGGGGINSGGNGGFGGGGGSGIGGDIFGGGPGDGGLFGGKGSLTSRSGGGGGGLGGAIFNDGGTLVIKNSTFTGNYAVRGNGGRGGGQNGHDAGGAIFSLNGSTVILSSTIYGNETTGALGGVVVQEFEYNGTPEVTFRIYNSIVAKNGAFDINGQLVNGADGCAVSAGPEAVVEGVANVIETSIGCPGIVSKVDPLAGPLRIESPGVTPTMAIASISSAFDVGNPNAWLPHTALLSDQRGIDRPQGLTMDIGAYELCLGDPNSASPCQELVVKPPQDTFDLVLGSSLPMGGTVLPGLGTTAINIDTVAVITAVPNARFAFLNWTGAVADPTAPTTTVLMSESRTITVNFVPWVANLAGKGVPGPNPKSKVVPGTVLAQPRAELTWMAAPVPVALYQILRAPSSGGTPVPVGTTTGLSFVDQSGLQNSTVYSYILHALDAQGLVVGRSNVALVTIPNPK